MGAFLAHPKTEKVSESGGDAGKDMYAASSMQGWRQTMEDAHIAVPSISKLAQILSSKGTPAEKQAVLEILPILEAHGIEDLSIYGVFDGHGSNAVSAWCAVEFLNVFANRLIDAHGGFKRDTLPPEATVNGECDSSIITPDAALLCSSMQRTFMAIDQELMQANTRVELVKYFEQGLKEQEGAKTYLHRFLSDGGDARVVDLVVKNEDDADKDSKDEKITEADASESPKEKSARSLMRFNSTEIDSDSQETPADVSSSDSAGGVVSEDADDDSSNNEVDASADEIANKKEKIEEDDEDNDYEAEEPKDVAQRINHPHPSTPEGSGTTSTVCIVAKGEFPLLITANAGDSRCVLSRNGVACPLSHDHKPTNPIERARIHAAGGIVMNGRVDGNLNLSRSLGDLYYKTTTHVPAENQRITAFPDVRVTPICPTDEFVIIACDGIWDCKTNQEAVTFVRERLTPDADETVLTRICEELCDACLSADPIESEGHGCDNMTVVIVLLGKNIRGTASKTSPKVVLYGGGEDTYIGMTEPEYDDDE